MADSNSSDSNATPKDLADFFNFPSGADSNSTPKKDLSDFFDFDAVMRAAEEEEKKAKARDKQASLAFPARFRKNRKTLSPELHKQLLYQEWVAARDEALKKSKKKGE